MFVFSYGLEQEELFSEIVLIHHKVEGVVNFPLILIHGYVCFSLGIDRPQGTVEVRDAL